MAKKEVLEVTVSDFVENFFVLQGKPFSLDDYPHMREIYNTNAQDVVMKFSRQTAKSTSLANLVLARAAMTPNTKQLYVSPATAQSLEWSRDKLEPVIQNSPLIRDHFVNPKLVQNVLKKEFANGSVINVRYALLNADRIRGISADYNYFDECFTPDMEVLTGDGWKAVSDLKLTDSLATVDSNNNLEFQNPSRIVAKNYTGSIYKFKHRSSVLKVTPNHNLYVSQELNTGYYRNPKRKGWFLAKAKEFKNKNFKMLSAPNKVHRKSPKIFKIEGFITKKAVSTGRERIDGRTIEHRDLNLDAKAFAKFLGWYIAEGHFVKSSYAVIISQNEGEDADKIRNILNKLGLPYKENTGGRSSIAFTISNGTLWNYVSSLGDSYNKYIPKEFFNEYLEYLPDLVKAIYEGDAIKRPGTANSLGELKTSSKQLADDVQKAWLYMGVRSSIRESRDGLRRGYTHLHYLVRPLQYDYQIFWNTADRVEEEPYTGKVYCATVPNGTLIVRHKDEKGIFITGNCQDLRKDVITVVQETMSRSMIKKTVYAGTPKRTRGTLADLWYKSTQFEYVIKCDACNHWNILGADNIGLNGLICSKCGEGIDLRVAKGEWASTFDDPNKMPEMEGYRVCLLHFAHSPWVN